MTARHRLPIPTLALLLVAVAASACIEDPATQKKRAEKEQVADILAEGLSYADPYVRAETIRLLSHTPATHWQADAEAMLDDPDPLVSLAAADVLLGDRGGNGLALAALDRWTTSDNAVAATAAVDVAARRLAYEAQMGIVNRALESKLAAPRRAAVATIVSLLEQGKTPETKEARKLEQRLGSLATDLDVGVSIVALRYLGSVSRLVSENQERRNALAQVAREGTLEARQRALSILVGLEDPRLKALVHDAYADASSVRELAPLADVAALGLATIGETSSIADLDKLLTRDQDLDLQKAALTALAHVDAPGALQSLNQALESPNPELRLHVLRVATPVATELRVPDSVLKDELVDVRVLALQMVLAQGKSRFQRVITQKLDVPEFRSPLLTAIAAWADDEMGGDGAKVPDWLRELAPTLQELRKQFGDDDAIGAPLYQLVCLLEGPKGLLADLDTLPHSARYSVLRAAIEAGVGTPDVFRAQLDSPYFAVRLAAAVGMVKTQR